MTIFFISQLVGLNYKQNATVIPSKLCKEVILFMQLLKGEKQYEQFKSKVEFMCVPVTRKKTSLGLSHV